MATVKERTRTRLSLAPGFFQGRFGTQGPEGAPPGWLVSPQPQREGWVSRAQASLGKASPNGQ